MRTTVEIEDELIVHLKNLAHQQGITLGQVISDLARRSLGAAGPVKVRNGVRLFSPKTRVERPTLRLVNELRDDR